MIGYIKRIKSFVGILDKPAYNEISESDHIIKKLSADYLIKITNTITDNFTSILAKDYNQGEI